MKLGITGLPQSGKKTVFEALTGRVADGSGRMEDRVETVTVPDPRVDVLSGMYRPEKTIYAQIEYLLPLGHDKNKEQGMWSRIRECDALIRVVRNFEVPGLENPSPLEDFRTLDEEFMISDMAVAEKRLEKIAAERHRSRKTNPEEAVLLERCLKLLEDETPVRRVPELAAAPALRGFTFLSAKPALILFNNSDDDELPPAGEFPDPAMAVRGKLEHEIMQMSDSETEEFFAEFNIRESVTARVLKKSYELMGLMSFFTVGRDEVRAWTIKEKTSALDAADVIHSDIKKGFIRAELVAYDHLIAAGSWPEAKKQGVVRLEGKTYEMRDGDIVNFRFNV